jgi:hypothetical protein
MKTSTSRLSVGFVGFLGSRREASAESSATGSALSAAQPLDTRSGAQSDIPDTAAAPRKPWIGYFAEAQKPAAFRKPAESSVTPDSRHPLIEESVRAMIEAVEPQARALGWPAELLWNSNFWDRPRGLASLLDPEDSIAEVTADHISILKTKRDLLRFQRRNA